MNLSSDFIPNVYLLFIQPTADTPALQCIMHPARKRFVDMTVADET